MNKISLTGTAKSIAKHKVKKKIIQFLISTIPAWLPFVLIGIVATFVFFGFYGSMSEESDLNASGIFDEVDAAEKQEYVDMAEKHTGPWISQGQLEESHAIPWGLLYALDMLESETKGQPFVNTAEETAKRLKPYFTYKDSTVITVTVRKNPETGETSRSESERDVKLLMTADTYKGFYTYRYERKTETTHPDEYTRRTTTKDYLVGIDYKEDWTRLEDEMRRRGLKVDDKNIERTMVVEMGDGYTAEEKALEWLLHTPAQYYSGGFFGEIPAQYLEWFKEAGERFGVPWYILAAIAKTESSTFDTEAIGPPNPTGELAQGMMQFLPSTWAAYGIDADGDGVANPFSAKDAIFSAANYISTLVEKRGSMEAALSQYGGDSTDRYATKVLELANSYKDQEQFGANGEYIWPVTGHTSLSSEYGMRRHPIKGTWSLHDGIDIPAKTGTPILSVVGGRVEASGYVGGWGLRVTVRGIDGNLYMYAHMSSIAQGIKKGASVFQGAHLGGVGSTGYSTGSHLHFGVYAGGEPMDPLLLYR